MSESESSQRATSPSSGAKSARADQATKSDASSAPEDDAETAERSAHDNGNGGGSTDPAEASADSTDESGDDDASAQSENGDDREGDDEEEKPLFARGNPLRRKRGAIVAGAGSLVAFLLMASSTQWRLGVPVGAIAILVATFGVLDLFGSFDDPAETVASETTLAALRGPLLRFGAMVLAWAGVLMGAQAGVGPQWVWGGLVTGVFIGLVAAVFSLGHALGPWKTDETGKARPLTRRHGFWVLVFAALLYLPTLGSYSLWDPWETHYGEVAREILARDDWISLWWAQDGWFFSKPILNFWIQAIAMATLGTHYQPDQMLMGAGGPGTAHPEWVVRAPNFLMTAFAMYVIYKGVAKVFGRRAGLFGAAVLATAPDWYFLAHQTMTDMPLVASMTAAMGFLLLGLNSPESETLKTYEVRAGKLVLRFSGWHLVFGAIVLFALPQALYLISRNVDLVLTGDGQKGFMAHFDIFQSGSGGGNCGLPGNSSCTSTHPASIPKGMPTVVTSVGMGIKRYFMAFEPSLQGLVWGGVIGTVLYINWGERRTRRMFYLAGWICAAIATMAKGPAGFALPMICAFAYIAAKRRFGELARLELLSGLLIILGVAIPWFVAMYVRHGSPFTDRLIFHDMFNRAFSHVHDTNEGDDISLRYYVWQLGYALFPWSALAPLGFLHWMRRGDSVGRGRGDTSIFLAMWFLFAFALFSYMGTKFHHYIFPAIPPAAMLIGIVLDDLLRREEVYADVAGVRTSTSIPSSFFLLTAGSIGLGVVILTRIQEGYVVGEESRANLWAGGLSAALIALSFVVQRTRLSVLEATPPPPDSDEDDTVDATILPPEAAPGELDLGDSPETHLFDGPPEGAEGAEAARASATQAAIDLPPPEPVDAFGETEHTTEREETAATHGPRGVMRTFRVDISPESAALYGGAIFSGALLLGVIGRDLFSTPPGASSSGAIRLLQLFTYNYRRPWPTTLNFNPTLAAITLIGVVILFAMAMRRYRRIAIVAFFAFATMTALWGIDVYMMKTAQHWGQHEVIEAYYRDRKSPDEVLVAYQMNWKGENFYTGNRVPAFVSSGAPFTRWVDEQKKKGKKVIYFVTEHSRTGGLRGEAGARKYTEITDQGVCNKFVLVRAEY